MRTVRVFDCGEALSEITAITNKMRQGRSSASSSGNQLRKRRFITHDLEKCREDPCRDADVIGHGSHRFGERDPGSCMACSDVNGGTPL